MSVGPAQVDVWALGISAIEMAEVKPPRWAVHPMRVIFMISREPPPRLADDTRWSLTLQNFVATCLQKVLCKVSLTCGACRIAEAYVAVALQVTSKTLPNMCSWFSRCLRAIAIRKHAGVIVKLLVRAHCDHSQTRCATLTRGPEC